MSNQRPDPDELLARVPAEESQQGRGKLNIIFGAAAGVGKTYARLDSWPAYLWGVLVVIICTLIAWAMFPYFAQANLIMVYLVGVMVTAIRFGRGPSILASVLSVAAFDFFYVVPYLTFAVSDTQYVVTFAVMLLVGLTISDLTARVQQQAVAARQREKHTATLYAMSRELASTRGRTNLAQIAVRQVGEMFESRVAIFLPDENGRLGLETVGHGDFCQDANERGVAQWVYDHRQVAGLGMETLPGASALYLPLVTLQDTVGVLGICPAQPRRFRAPEQVHLLETFAQQIALALARAQLAEEAEQTHIQVETEQLRNSLLSSVSHDLRTPLAAIMGAASTMLDNNVLDITVRHELTQSIYEEANRLNIVLSAREQEEDKVLALDAGADDYLTKPFGVRELLARIRVALRHAIHLTQAADNPVFSIGELRVDLAKRQVFVAETEIHLTPTEYKVLSTLVRYAGKVVTQPQLLKAVWGPASANKDHNLRVHMAQLRQKLEADPTRPRYVVTEPGVGYRLKVDAHE